MAPVLNPSTAVCHQEIAVQRSVIRHRTGVTGALLLGALALGACAGMTRTQQGAVIGAGVGAAAGAGVAAATDASTTKSVLIGAVVGGAAGAIIGQQMD